MLRTLNGVHTRSPNTLSKMVRTTATKLQGSVAVANYDEVTSFNEAQKVSIYGLGRGGNIPLDAITKFTELNDG